MILSEFQAENYRNIEKATVLFAPGINLLLGSNAEGKTNLLEGIYTFARGRSFRGASDREQVRFGTGGFRIGIRFLSGGSERSLGYRFFDGRRERTRNGAPLSSLRQMLGQFRAVLFTPGHLSLIKDGPAERRLFLNIGISQLSPLYIAALARYETILENRNRLLREEKSGVPTDAEQLSVFTEALAEACVPVALFRAAYAQAIGAAAGRVCDRISEGKEVLHIAYRSTAEIPPLPALPGGRPLEAAAAAPAGIREKLRLSFLSRMQEMLPREKAAGCSLCGVHLDDLAVELNDRPARSFASQGQQRSAVLAMKLAEGEVCRAACGEYPVFLLDDVLSELDAGRRAFLLSQTADSEKQVIVTSCEQEDFGTRPACILRVKEGSYAPAYR